MISVFSSLRRSLCSLWIFFVSLDINIIEGDCTTSAEIDRHLEMGVQMLARGQFHDALSHFHAAIDGDPLNYLTYYRRATVYLALGRSKAGLQDLNEVLKHKPDFTAARIQRANVLYKSGRLDEAHIDLEKILRKEPENAEANHLYVSIEPLKNKIHTAQLYIKSYMNSEAVDLLKEVIEECPWDSSLRNIRIEAYQAIGDIMSAIADLRATTKLMQDNTQGYYKLSGLYYRIGDVEQSLNEIRECLKLDPDHKECFTFYKKVKKINKLSADAQEYLNNKEYEECSSRAHKILEEEKTEGEVRFIAYDKLCQCERHIDPHAAVKACTEAISIKEEPRLFCDRAEAYILKDQFDDAISDFQKALQIDEHLQRAREGVDKAQKLKKQASKRDYYKILGVTRSASKKEINKAYRNLAQKWHPDHYDGDDKKHAEKMFIDIASAKEVLTDDEMREKFDNGEDPLDPESQAGKGFNPFQGFHFHPGGGFNGFGGGPFQFKFHFN